MDALLSTGAIPSAVVSDYEVANSCKFEKDNSERLQRASNNIGTPTNADKFTFSIWLKRMDLQPSGEDIFFCGNAGAVSTIFGFQNDVLKFRTNSGDTEIKTNRLFRDTAAWYHIVVAYDSTDSTEANRVKFYVNGVQETSLGTANYPTQNADSEMYETNMSHFVGSPDGSQTVRGYYTELYFLDGQVKQASDFGRFDSNGVWVPKAYSGSFGDEGYYLDFEDSSNLGLDVSGNSNSFGALYGISAIDQATDTPTNNFCTMNQNARTNGNIRTQEGGTYVTTDGGSGWCGMVATMFVGAGKWYWEALYYDNSDADDVHIGIAAANDPWFPARQVSGGYYLGNVETGGAMGWDLDGGTNYNQNGSWGNPSRGDKLMVALDMDNYKLYYGINGTWGNSANPANGTGSVTAIESYWMSGINGALDFVAPAVSIYQGNRVRAFNFGGVNTWTIASGNADANGYGNFEYAPPSGFYALCSKNLAQYG